MTLIWSVTNNLFDLLTEELSGSSHAKSRTYTSVVTSASTLPLILLSSLFSFFFGTFAIAKLSFSPSSPHLFALIWKHSSQSYFTLIANIIVVIFEMSALLDSLLESWRVTGEIGQEREFE